MNKDIVTFAAGKGGAGKTLIDVSCATVLAAQGYKVLLIDLDRQAQACANVGVDRTDGVYQLLTGSDGDGNRVTFDQLPLVEARPNLFVIPGNEATEDAEYYLLQNSFGPKHLRNILADPWFDRFDFILIDTPSQGYRSMIAVAAADLIIAPVIARKIDADGLQMFAGAVLSTNSAVPVIIVPNRIDNRTGRSKQVISDLQSSFVDSQAQVPELKRWQFSPFALPETVAIDRAFEAGMTLPEVEPRCRFSESIRGLTALMIGVLKFAPSGEKAGK